MNHPPLATALRTRARAIGQWLLTPQAIWWAALLLLPITAARLVRAASTVDLSQVSEVWAALAYDWHAGTPYRPLFSELGYGGTRYFPASMALQSAAMSVASPAGSGYVVTVLGLVLLLSSGYGLLRQFGVGRFGSLGGISLVFMSLVVQHASVATRGDLLPASLGLCGLWASGLLAEGPVSRTRLACAAVLFAAGWMGKMTSIAAPATALAVFWFGGRRREAIFLLGGSILAAILLAAWAQGYTHGRFLSVVGACANERFSLLQLAGAPVKMLNYLVLLMGLSVPLLLLAVPCALGTQDRRKLGPLMVYIGLSLLVALAIYTGYGTEHNHLLESEVASALFLAAALSSGAVDRQLRILALGACLLASWNLLFSVKADLYIGLARSRKAPTRISRYPQVLELVRGDPNPIFSAFPLLPLERGERPYLLDAWMFAAASERDPAVLRDFHDRLRSERFSAVVLAQNPADPAARAEIDEWFKPGAADLIREHYVPAWSLERFYVLLPRRRAPGTPAPK